MHSNLNTKVHKDKKQKLQSLSYQKINLRIKNRKQEHLLLRSRCIRQLQISFRTQLMIQNRMRMQGRIKPMLKTCRSMILNHKLQMINPKRNLMRRRKSQLNKSNTSHQQVQALLSCRQLHQHSLLNNQTHNLKNQKRRKKKVLPPNSQLNNQQHQVGCLHSHS